MEQRIFDSLSKLIGLRTSPGSRAINDIGSLEEGNKIQTNVQPVIPFKMGPDWNLIARTILPIISQDDIVPGARSQFGLGDTSVSMFFSPTETGPGGAGEPGVEY